MSLISTGTPLKTFLVLLGISLVDAANIARDADDATDGGDMAGQMTTPHGQSYNRAAVAHAVGKHQKRKRHR